MVLNGLTDNHWARIRQVVMEVENFTILKTITTILESKGFTVSSVASEREKNPAATSEVSMVYATRKGLASSSSVNKSKSSPSNIVIPVPGASNKVIDRVISLYGNNNSNNSTSVDTTSNQEDEELQTTPVSGSTNKSVARKRQTRKD